MSKKIKNAPYVNDLTELNIALRASGTNETEKLKESLERLEGQLYSEGRYHLAEIALRSIEMIDRLDNQNEKAKK